MTGTPTSPSGLGPEGIAAAIDLLVAAFDADPTWGWVFPDPATRPARLRWLWGEMVAGSARYDGVHLAPGGVAASVWIPPGGTELAPEQEAPFDDAAAALPPLERDRLHGALGAFDAAHPHDQPHHYLSLLGTSPAHRGRGHGLALLAADLRRVDAEGMAAYLEASNPANVALYARYGFEQIGSFRVGPDGPDVPTMWRRPAG